MQYTTLLVDLDDTVYRPETGLWAQIRERIGLYMHERLKLSWEEIPDLRRQFLKEYGTTMRGLVAVYGINEKEYLDFVHDLPIDQYLTPDPILYERLASIPLRRVIFTNADRWHAHRVLRAIGIQDLFEQVIDILDTYPYCKPMPEAFNRALQLAGENDPARCIFIDDTAANLARARELGLYTISVNNSKGTSCAHVAIDSLHDLPDVILSPSDRGAACHP